MLHGGSVSINSSTMLGNTAAAASGTAAASAVGSGTGSETIQYMLGEVQVSAGGAAYVWRGRLQLNRCKVVSNAAWGATGRGGGVFVDDAELLLVDTAFSDNWATAAGGAVLLGPTGVRQLLDVRGGRFEGNGAGLYGGAVAGGLLLPGDSAAASARASSASGSASSSRWTLVFNHTVLVNNTAGRQGGAVACSLCDSLVIADTLLQQNGAAQTGGGLSCVGCSKLSLDNSTFSSNTAASGGGACILAAGEGSVFRDAHFIGNAAGSAAAAASQNRSAAAMSAALAVAGTGSARSSAIPAITEGSKLPTAQQALPACGVVGSGGGLCLGLWGTEVLLRGSGRYLNNSALFGAGLFIDACPEGREVCPVQLDPKAVVFRHNVLSDDDADDLYGERSARHLLPVQAAVADDDVAGSLGSGADLYVTNATVLVTQKKAGQQTSELPAAAAGEASKTAETPASARTPKPAQTDTASAASANTSTNPAAAPPTGRHLLAQPQAVVNQTTAAGSNSSRLKPLAVAQQIAAAVQPSAESGARSADDVISRVATGPSRLGAIMVTGDGFVLGQTDVDCCCMTVECMGSLMVP